ncbi:MAG: hypothetical protein QM767_24855 [Anaeromyxobacter sp.]
MKKGKIIKLGRRQSELALAVEVPNLMKLASNIRLSFTPSCRLEMRMSERW